MCLFPRDCPRILIWATAETPETERRQCLGDFRAAAYVERHWLEELREATIHCYELPTDGFEDLGDAGMWVAHGRIVPFERTAIARLDGEFAPRGVELRVVDSLRPLKSLWDTGLHVSGIGLRNVRDWE